MTCNQHGEGGMCRRYGTGVRNRVYLAVAAFFALGMPRTALGVFWPSAATEFNRPLVELGNLLLMFVAVYGSATLISGRAARRVGPGRLLGTAASLATFGLVGMLVSGNWTGIVWSLAVLAFGGGLIDAGINAQVAIHHGPRAMALLHTAVGVSGMLGPGLLTVGLTLTGSWRPGFAAFGVLHCGVALALIAGRSWWLPLPPPDRPDGQPNRLPPAVWVGLVTFALITAVDSAAIGFGFSLLRGRGLGQGAAGLAVAGVSAGWMVPRLTVALVGHRGGFHP
jgi:MFS family permease